MSSTLILEQIDRNELKSLIAEVVREELKNLQTPQDRYLTREDVCDILHISKNMLNSLTKSGKLVKYRLQGKVLYKESELSLSLKKADYGVRHSVRTKE